MNAPQPGILALGTPAHAYLEFDLAAGANPAGLASAVAALAQAQTTGGGLNLVVGLRPELWRKVAPDDAPEGLSGFDAKVVGVEGFSMPATQHDAVVWIAGAAPDAVFDAAAGAIASLARVATLVSETVGWPYQGHRDLTGFIDGTENPPVGEAQAVALVADGHPGAGGSVLLLQKWMHDAATWNALPAAEQEKIMGRRKPDSVELEDKPESSHVARTDQDEFGKIVRRNMPVGTASEHGTMFVGFCASQRPLAAMLDSMAGKTTGVRDALTRFSRPISGAYYFVPALTALQRIAAA